MDRENRLKSCTDGKYIQAVATTSAPGAKEMKANTIENRLSNTAVSRAKIANRVSVVESYIHALNAADIDAVVDIFNEDAIVLDPLGSQPITGRSEIKNFYTNGPFLHPIVASLDGEVKVAGNSAAFTFTAHSDGKKMEIIDVFEFDSNDKVSKMIAYWSSANVSRSGS